MKLMLFFLDVNDWVFVKQKTSRLLRVASCAELKLMNELQRVAKLDALKETIRLQRLGACTLLKLLRPVGCSPGVCCSPRWPFSRSSIGEFRTEDV